MFFTVPLGLDQMRVRGVPRVSLAIAVACILGYLALLPSGEEAYFAYGMIPAQGVLQLGSLTSLFVHAGLFHLLFNLVFLYLSAPVVEDAWGWPLFTLLYFAGGFVADLGQWLLDPASLVPTVGASGAIAACMGALCVQFPRRKVRMFYWVFPRFTGLFFVSVWLWGGFWFVTEVFNLFTAGEGAGVAFGAHVAGFVFGALMAVVVVKVRGEPATDVAPAPKPSQAPRVAVQPVATKPAAPPVAVEPQPAAPPTPKTAAESQAPKPDADKPKPRTVPKAPVLRSDRK